MMEAPGEVAMASHDQSNNNNNIIKGKRTKRSRPQSPIPFSITSQNSNSAHDHVGKLIPNISSSSSSEYRDNTEEEEDMAKCLILLAQGQSREFVKQQVDHHNHNHDSKFTSKKFMEPASIETGKASYHVYECKTCTRTFPSFQALGGHRASHKKPKAVLDVTTALGEERTRQFTSSSSLDAEEGQFIKTNSLSSLSLQLGKFNNVISKPKVHECAICGAAFSSGQALGGHMRRHKTVANNTAFSLTVPMTMEVDHFRRRPEKHVLCIDFDLNLPAPEDDHLETNFPFVSKQEQQSTLVFPAAPTLVDCHY